MPRVGKRLPLSRQRFEPAIKASRVISMADMLATSDMLVTDGALGTEERRPIRCSTE